MGFSLKKFSFGKKKQIARGDAIINNKTSFEVKEAYKAARTNLMFVLGKDNKENNGNVVLFTSSRPGEGKSTTCINMAITVAQAGMRVLVIDADMRKPTVHRNFGIDAVPGLSDKLSGMNEESCIYEISCGNLFVLPAGTIPPNPAELLASEAMEELIASASKEFDYVFIDTPPVGVVTDAASVAGKIAGAVLVVRSNITTTDDVKEIKQRIEFAGGKILGTIINGVDTSNGTKYKYKRYGGYKRSYGYGYGYGYGHTSSEDSKED